MTIEDTRTLIDKKSNKVYHYHLDKVFAELPHYEHEYHSYPLSCCKRHIAYCGNEVRIHVCRNPFTLQERLQLLGKSQKYGMLVYHDTEDFVEFLGKNNLVRVVNEI